MSVAKRKDQLQLLLVLLPDHVMVRINQAPYKPGFHLKQVSQQYNHMIGTRN